LSIIETQAGHLGEAKRLRHRAGRSERALLARLEPPLNLQHVTTPWAAQVKAARKVMADDAREAGGGAP
jgi:hypothetical protein